LLRNLNLWSLLYSLPAILIALSFHEFAHAWVADRMGDPTPRLHGRLSLSPFAHIDLMGFLVMLVGGFGWAKPVPINTSYFRDRRKGEALTAAAGPMMNLLLAFAFAAADILVRETVPGFIGSVLRGILYSGVRFDVALLIFNFIPIPPLDGFKVLKMAVPAGKREWLWKMERYGSLLLLLLLITGISSWILGIFTAPLISFVYYPFELIAQLLG